MRRDSREAVQRGDYHIAVGLCPDKDRRTEIDLHVVDSQVNSNRLLWTLDQDAIGRSILTAGFADSGAEVKGLQRAIDWRSRVDHVEAADIIRGFNRRSRRRNPAGDRLAVCPGKVNAQPAIIL